MIVTGIFLFLMGTRIDKALAVHADVRYEPGKITIKEQIDQSPVVITHPGPPNFVHQGSNYFFGSPLPKPSGFVPLSPSPGRIEVMEEEIMFAKPHFGKESHLYTNPAIKVNGKQVINNPIEVIEEDIIFAKPNPGKENPLYMNPAIKVNGKEVINYPIEVIEEDIIFAKPHLGKENPLYTNPAIKVNGKEVFHYPKLTLPLPNASLSMPPGSFLPPFVNSQLLSQLPLQSLAIPPGTFLPPFVNSQFLSQLPFQPLTMPGFPDLSKAPYLSRLIEKPVRVSNDVIISEVDLLVKKIPPPPQLPPLKLEEIFQSVVVEENKIILVPPPPKIEAVLPPSIVLTGHSCPPTLCARNIVFERVLPNIICEKSKKVELISIPASMKHPVVTTSFLPYIINI